MDFSEMGAALKRQWPIVLVLALLGGALFGGFASFQPTQYESQAQVLVATATTDDGRRGEGAYSNALLAAQLSQTYGYLGESLPFRMGLIDAVGLDVSEPELKNALTVEGVPGTGLIEISARDENPQVAQTLAQGTALRLVEQIEDSIRDAPSGAQVTATTIGEPTTPLPGPGGRAKAVVGGAILGLLAGLAILLTRQLIQRRVFTEAQASEVAQQPSLGGIAQDADINGELAKAGGRGRVAEEFRALRSSLEAANATHQHRMILVTSPLSGAGTTTVVAGLGAVLGDAGKRVLLVDANLRNGDLSRLTGHRDAPRGIVDVLTGSPWADALQSWRGIDVLPAGRTDAVPSDLFDSEKARILWTSLRDRYDFVLVDSTAILAVADSRPLASAADEAIIIVDSGATRADDLDRAARDIDQLGTPLAGIVVNRQRLGRGSAQRSGIVSPAVARA